MPFHFYLRRDIWRRQAHDALIYWVYVPGGVILAGKGLDRLLNLPSWPLVKLIAPVAVALLLTGGWLIARATADLADLGQGTPNPFRPPKRLVVTGSYALCRHPMFLGYDLAALGVVLLFGSFGMLLGSGPAFFAAQLWFLTKEEKILVARFRDDYVRYCGRVPFLFPRFPFKRSTA